MEIFGIFSFGHLIWYSYAEGSWIDEEVAGVVVDHPDKSQRSLVPAHLLLQRHPSIPFHRGQSVASENAPNQNSSIDQKNFERR